jgi:voltage-gated potassium channel
MFIFRESRVTKDVLFAAIIVYLMMGIMWAGVYAFLSKIDPSSFEIGSLEKKDPNLIFTYYSFVTLTTLGYGDITPMTDITYALAILEAIIGQLFLTVLVARLVALHITHSHEQANNREDIENKKE